MGEHIEIVFAESFLILEGLEIGMTRAEDLRLKLLVKQAVKEELDEFYRRLALLVEGVSGSELTPMMNKVAGLLEQGEMTAEEIAQKRNTSRAAAAQACGRLYRLGLVEKVRKSKKVYYRRT